MWHHSPPKFATQNLWNLAQIPNSHRFVKICENLAKIPQICQSMKRFCGVHQKHPSAVSGDFYLQESDGKQRHN